MSVQGVPPPKVASALTAAARSESPDLADEIMGLLGPTPSPPASPASPRSAGGDAQHLNNEMRLSPDHDDEGERSQPCAHADAGVVDVTTGAAAFDLSNNDTEGNTTANHSLDNGAGPSSAASPPASNAEEVRLSSLCVALSLLCCCCVAL